MPTIKSVLTITSVDHGGNTGNGKYQYQFTPDYARVTQKDTELVYVLDSKSTEHFEIYSYAFSDPEAQIKDVQLTTKKLTMNNICTSDNELILLAILVKDTRNKEIVNCSPQITNTP